MPSMYIHSPATLLSCNGMHLVFSTKLFGGASTESAMFLLARASTGSLYGGLCVPVEQEVASRLLLALVGSKRLEVGLED